MRVSMPAAVPVAPPAGLNRRIYLDINRFARHTSWAHGFMHAYALWAGLVLLALLDVGAYLWSRRRPDAPARVARSFLAGLSAVVALGVNQPVAHLVGERRPYATLPGVEVLVARANDFAFPSDHATIAGAFIVGLFLVDRRFGYSALGLGLFLAFARVYVGAHFPGDVVAGLLLGAVVAAAITVLLGGLARRVAELLAGSPLAVLVSVQPRTGVAGHAATGTEHAQPTGGGQ